MSETPEIPAAGSARAPGEILRQAREAKNLSIAAIATQMNLDLRTVEALEQGDVSRLPAPIFVRGYLRGFARLVDVPEAVVLSAYQALAPQEPTPRAVGTRSAPLRPAFRVPMIPWRGLLLTTALLVVAWLGFAYGPQIWRQFTALSPVGDSAAPGTDPMRDLRLPLPTDGVPDTTHAAPVPTAPEAATAPADAVPDPAPASAGALDLALPAPQASLAGDATAQPAATAEPNLPSESDFGTPAAAPQAATGAMETAAPAVPSSVPAAAETASVPAPAPGELQLELRFSAESWVEVRNADRSKLLFGLFNKGETRSVTGKAPISVLLGNARGVELRVNGKSFDLAPRSRDNIARFELTAAD